MCLSLIYKKNKIKSVLQLIEKLIYSSFYAKNYIRTLCIVYVYYTTNVQSSYTPTRVNT